MDKFKNASRHLCRYTKTKTTSELSYLFVVYFLWFPDEDSVLVRAFGGLEYSSGLKTKGQVDSAGLSRSVDVFVEAVRRRQKAV